MENGSLSGEGIVFFKTLAEIAHTYFRLRFYSFLIIPRSSADERDQQILRKCIGMNDGILFFRRPRLEHIFRDDGKSEAQCGTCFLLNEISRITESGSNSKRALNGVFFS